MPKNPDPKLACADVALTRAYVPVAKHTTKALRLVGVTCHFQQLDSTGEPIKQAGRAVEISIGATSSYVQGICPGEDGAMAYTDAERTLKDLDIGDAITAALLDAGLI